MGDICTAGNSSITGHIFHRNPNLRNMNSNKTEHGENRPSMFVRILMPMVVELIATTVFLFIGLLGSCNSKDALSDLWTALSFGLALVIIVASFGPISGAHLNPAVTIGIFIAGGIELKKAVCYVLIQLIGGIMAAGMFRLHAHALTYRHCHGAATYLPSVNYTVENGRMLIDRLRWWEGLSMELLLTFAFVTVILMVTMSIKAKTNLAPIYIGSTLSACILASNSLTGASFNPARSLGTAIFANVWSDHYIYWLGPILGGMIAGVFYRFLWNRL